MEYVRVLEPWAAVDVQVGLAGEDVGRIWEAVVVGEADWAVVVEVFGPPAQDHVGLERVVLGDEGQGAWDVSLGIH